MRGFTSDSGAELLNGPVRGRMRRHIPVKDPSRADLQHDEHTEELEAGGHRDEEVTGQDRMRVIPHERRPPL
jgi:hypothetical protein